MINEGFCRELFLEPPEILKCFCLISTQGLIFFYMIFWYFFLLLLWSIICHQLFLLLVTFIFGSMGKTATCLTPGIRDFGHWFWKIGCDAHNLQPFNGLISKINKSRGHFPSRHNYVTNYTLLSERFKDFKNQTVYWCLLIKRKRQDMFL